MTNQRAAEQSSASPDVAIRDVIPGGLRRARRYARRTAGAMLPDRVAWRLGGRSGPPPVGVVNLGDLRRLSPLSKVFGFDRGRPIDRHYIEAFLGRHADDVCGRVLEIGDDGYTRWFGGEHVTASTVLDVNDRNPLATLIGDLADGAHLPSAAFDCIVLTQTLQFIYDVHAALGTVFRMLAPRGVLLLTVPGISQVDSDDWCWAFTPYALRRLLRDVAADAEVEVEACGNVLTATAFLHGLADAELTPDELDHHDPAYPMVITARVVKA